MSLLNRKSFNELLEGNLEWLLEQPRTLERDHIEHILKYEIKHGNLYDASRIDYITKREDNDRKYRNQLIKDNFTIFSFEKISNYLYKHDYLINLLYDKDRYRITISTNYIINEESILEFIKSDGYKFINDDYRLGSMFCIKSALFKVMKFERVKI